MPLPSDLLSSYHAESAELLADLRRQLLACDPRDVVPPDALASSFRILHTLKGIAGMVGFGEIEVLLHHAESLVRGMADGGDIFDADAIALIGRTIEAIETAHAARQSGEEPMRVDALVGELAMRAASPVAVGAVAPPTASPESRAAAARAAGHVAWRSIFRPSAALAAQGIDITQVRALLEGSGELLDTEPRVTADFGMSFRLRWVARPGVTTPPDAPGLVHERWDVGATVPAPRPPTTQLVRVDLARLDDLMRITGDLVMTRARLAGHLTTSSNTDGRRETREILQRMERELRDLREAIMRVRLVPIGDVLERMPFVARELATLQGKQVRVTTSGGAIEIDKYLVERLLEPLLHLVRNAVAHGIEMPAVRERAGKPPCGSISIDVATEGESVRMEVRDDGAGVDVARVAARARTEGRAVPADPLAPSQLLDLLCAGGFSTRDAADAGSGRGVGLDIVRRDVGDLTGALTLDPGPGTGAVFCIVVPLTLLITDALVLTVGDSRFAVPKGAISEVIAIGEHGIERMPGVELVAWRGGMLPLVRLSTLFRIPVDARIGRHVLVLRGAARPVGLVVDAVVHQQEIVVRRVPDALARPQGIAGATDLGDGRPVFILDGPALADIALDHDAPAACAAAA